MSVCQMSLTERRGAKLRTKDIFDSDSAEIVLFFVLKYWSRLFFISQVFFKDRFYHFLFCEAQFRQT
jgi:hypothetical protein